MSEKRVRGEPYDHKTKMAVIADYYNTGSSVKTGKNFNIPDRTIRLWMQNDEDCIKLMQKLREENEEDFRIKAGKVREEATLEVLDRIRNGNVKVIHVAGEYEKDEEGERLEDEKGKPIPMTTSYREPVGIKELSTTAGIFTDKLRVSLNLPSRITGNVEGGQQMLDKFLEITRKAQEKKVDASIPHQES